MSTIPSGWLCDDCKARADLTGLELRAMGNQQTCDVCKKAGPAERWAPPGPEPPPESGWVIEHGDSKNGPPLYFAGAPTLYAALQSSLERHGIEAPFWQWSYSPDCAVRFARKLDAEKLLPALPFGPHRVVEHQWG